MELVDRYLQAVGSYLPSAQRQDILAELKDNLLSQVEERERALARPLNDEELQHLIKQSGHPMLVASGYLPQQQLIGPRVFPYWWFSLRLMVLIVAVVHVLLGGVFAVSSGDLLRAVLRAAHDFAGTALFYAAAITLVFALLDRYQIRIGLFDNWQPAKLAPVHEAMKISRGNSLFELIFGVLFFSWWLNLISFPTPIFHNSVALPFELSSAWQPFWWGILLLAISDIVLAVLNLLKPYWSTDRLLLRLLLNVISLVILYQLFQQPELITPVSAESITGNAVRLVPLLNQSVRWVLAIIALIALAEMIQDVRRLMLRR